ncbi:hypothetical protein JVT61DRAFT_5008 [Boletus reticuloceps]|uniref:Uncharacterized protein n=1 Tax=Boletus reticuloceps TaxID=495285 RepID=A0A8I2Z0X3_9AGAM|nr:hypothetical protein JVT61DRAFT_5008 [Boletus reticuloceps]
MSDTMSTQHPPALRVGGRRLSISARPKPHHASGTSAPAPTHLADNADYPRPAAQGEGEEQAHPPPHNEEEAPKKEKKHGHGGHDKNRLKESMYRKAEVTMPSKDHLASKNSFGGVGRIGQPMGKVLAV